MLWNFRPPFLSLYHNKMSNKKNIIKYRSGFTLIETFVAITILMIAILGPMSIIAKFYADSNYAKNQISAAFLAQDGMETVINLIRNNTELRRGEINSGMSCVDTSDWLSNGIKSCENGCNVNSVTGEVSICFNSTEGCKIINDSSGFYIGKDSGNGTIFTRQINISNINSPTIETDGDGYVINYETLRRSAQVTSLVWWQEKGKIRGPVVVSSLVIQNQCP